MAYSNVIVNGSFTLGDEGWSGTDIETSYPENAYLGNGSSNAVAELDGHRDAATVMEQTIKVSDAHTTQLTFRTALRTASLGNAGTEGFKVEVLDSNGTVIASQSFFPTTTTWTTQSVPVTFPAGGAYTIRLSEIGVDDSLGAIVDDVSLLVCFTEGTLIDTENGPCAVESLQCGDLVWAEDAGFQPVRWVGRRRIGREALLADPSLRPIVFAPGALGGNQPCRPLAVSPQHRVLLQGWSAELYFGHPEVLVPAQSLVNGRTIVRAAPLADVTYVHFLLDGHQIVRSDGVLTESFFPTELSLTGLERAARAEVLRMFPDLASLTHAYPRTARAVLRANEARLVA